MEGSKASSSSEAKQKKNKSKTKSCQVNNFLEDNSDTNMPPSNKNHININNYNNSNNIHINSDTDIDNKIKRLLEKNNILINTNIIDDNCNNDQINQEQLKKNIINKYNDLKQFEKEIDVEKENDTIYENADDPKDAGDVYIIDGKIVKTIFQKGGAFNKMNKVNSNYAQHVTKKDEIKFCSKADKYKKLAEEEFLRSDEGMYKHFKTPMAINNIFCTELLKICGEPTLETYKIDSRISYSQLASSDLWRCYNTLWDENNEKIKKPNQVKYTARAKNPNDIKERNYYPTDIESILSASKNSKNLAEKIKFCQFAYMAFRTSLTQFLDQKYDGFKDLVTDTDCRNLLKEEDTSNECMQIIAKLFCHNFLFCLDDRKADNTLIKFKAQKPDSNTLSQFEKIKKIEEIEKEINNLKKTESKGNKTKITKLQSQKQTLIKEMSKKKRKHANDF